MKTVLVVVGLLFCGCALPCEEETMCGCAARSECRVVHEACWCRSECDRSVQCICGGGKYLGCADR